MPQTLGAKAGRALRINRGNDASPQVFTPVSGAREDSISLNNELIDVTEKGDSGWRTLLNAVSGLQSMSMSCSGVVKDSVMISAWVNKTANEYQFEISGLGIFEGSFMIPSMELSGANAGEGTFSVTFESTGPITFTATA
jgi:TP901-1 family phage major tail protein